MKIFQRRSDKVRIALLGYMKPVRGLPDHRRLFFFSHVTNSIRVCLAPCVAYTYQRLSRKLIFGALIFVSVLSNKNIIRRKFSRRKFLQTKFPDLQYLFLKLESGGCYSQLFLQWSTLATWYGYILTHSRVIKPFHCYSKWLLMPVQKETEEWQDTVILPNSLLRSLAV